jgi:myosin heavy subunit
MAAMEPQKGDLAWICDRKAGFRIVKLESEPTEKTISVQVIDPAKPSNEGDIIQVPAAEVYQNSEGIQELVFLKKYSTSSILNALKWRYDHDQIYTNSGLFLIALNPFKWHKEIYSKDVMAEYKVPGVKSFTHPHIFGLVQRVYNTMKYDGTDQSILVSGLSGSGKTETTKFAIRYLGEISGGSEALEGKIYSAAPLLESFGNAKTIMNHNSSRFGKFTRIYFDKSFKMTAGEVQTYILEKSRVCFVPKNERNFHVFYRMIAGLPQEDLDRLHIKSVADFYYLRNGENSKVDLLDDANDFNKLRAAMEVLKFKEEKQRLIWRTLAGILHLGNIEFDEKDGKAVVKNQTALQHAAELLEFEIKDLEEALTLLRMQSMAAVINLSKGKAIISRDALAKDLYEKLFAWVVKTINSQIGKGNFTECNWIGILDISGYENLEENSLEQLCINYTNDKMQQMFNLFVHEEQELYKQELNWKQVDFDLDLKNTLDTFEADPNGLMHLFNELCFRTDDLDQIDLCQELNLIHAKTLVAEKGTFAINHGPGKVIYQAKDMLFKNRDLLSKSLADLVAKSKSKLILSLYKNHSAHLNSVSSFYMKQMSGLVKVLEEAESNYVKCVKPNKTASPGVVDVKYVRDQIKWNGVVETLKLIQKGFPVHYTPSKFLSRFKSLLSKENRKDAEKEEKRERKEEARGALEKKDKELVLQLCKEILASHLANEEYAVGQSKLFLRLDAQYKLDVAVASQDIPKSGSSFADFKKKMKWLILNQKD